MRKLMTPIEVAKEEAKMFGIELSDKDAIMVLWEYTGFPYYWHIGKDGDTPEECMRTQVREWAKETKEWKDKNDDR